MKFKGPGHFADDIKILSELQTKILLPNYYSEKKRMIEKLGKCFFRHISTAFLSGMKLTPAFTGHSIYFHKYLMIRARDPSTINIRICDDSDSDLDPAP